MNAVHQTFAPFLRSIAPPSTPTSRLQAQCDAQAAIIKRYQPPKVPIGQVEYVHRFGVMELVCHLEYEEAEPADGTSPAIAASAELIAAYANGMDVSEVLDAATVGLIQIKAAASLEE